MGDWLGEAWRRWPDSFFLGEIDVAIILGEDSSEESATDVMSVVLAQTFGEKAFKNLWDAPKMVTSTATNLVGLLQCSPYSG